ncbi:MAG: LysR family transcriptional regulator [Burkholderiales bacterium]|nr:LysR family transcriptional regulator [Burkholderiales bacterium]
MRLDLNLLVVLEVLLSEGSVTRAARRLNLAQPTVSNALSRLREHFKDPLLERSGNSMKPTACGQRLLQPVREALAKVDIVVQGRDQAFNPATAGRLVRVAASDYASAAFLPSLMDSLARQAPLMRVAISTFTSSDPIQELIAGKTDLLIGAFAKTSPDVHRYDLFVDELVCVVRKGHPSIRGKLSLKQFDTCSYITVQPQQSSVGGSVDDLLVHMARQRNVGLSLPHLFSAIQVVLASDLVLTIASRAAELFAAAYPIQIIKHPLQLKPFVVSQLWHERTHLDPALAWFRTVLAESTPASPRRAARKQPSRR